MADDLFSLEYSMNDDQVNAEELAENKRQREAAQNATDDGMPVAAPREADDGVAGKYGTLKQWVRRARSGIGSRHPLKQS
jgi:hypothetical protein